MPNARWEVANCLSKATCPLWPVRPWQQMADPAALDDPRVQSVSWQE